MMKICLLQLMEWLGENGYYARSEQELELLGKLAEKGLVKLKRGTRKVYVITEKGRMYWKKQALKETLQVPNGSRPHPDPKTMLEQVSEEQLIGLVTEAYHQLATDMRPLVQLPELRKIILKQLGMNEEKHDPKICKRLDDLLLKLHHEGKITLQRAMTARDAPDGIWTPNGVFYYVTIQQQ